MIALILNSGMGKRMGQYTAKIPKCMCIIDSENQESILQRQLRLLANAGISRIVMTTGPYHDLQKKHIEDLSLDINVDLVMNDRYEDTNYIYSIFLAKHLLTEDVLLIHGDLVFEQNTLQQVINEKNSAMVISTTKTLPEKDFKAVIEKNRIAAVGVEFFNSAVAAQPMYYLRKEDIEIWLKKIEEYCHRGDTSCYAEKALNEVLDQFTLHGVDIKDALCQEIDCEEDLLEVREKMRKSTKKTVLLSIGAEFIHGGHIAIIEKAAELGELTVGVLSDEAIMSYRGYPILTFEERCNIISHIKGVARVVKKDTLSYDKLIRELKPDYVVHGDNWKDSTKERMRALVGEYGGALIEFPYTHKKEYSVFDQRAEQLGNTPEVRRGKLKRALQLSERPLRVLEAHNGITGLIAEKVHIEKNNEIHQFDAIWISSLCDSTAKGKPDIELVDMTSREKTVNEIMEVTTKPIILDGDTGGLIEHFIYNVKTLERLGVSAIIIEDKIGLKRNSLFGTDVEQTQDSIEHFCEKIREGKAAQRTREFMIIARIESLILEQGMDDALKRASAYVQAGADGIMIHSKKKDGREIAEFCQIFRQEHKDVPLIVVPTTYNHLTEKELGAFGVNVIIYANHLIRSAFPAMNKVAHMILENGRSLEANEICMPIQDILTLI